MAVGLHMQVVYERLRVTGTEDVAITTHDFWAPGASDFTTSWMDTIAADFTTHFITGLTARLSQKLKVREFRFYDDYNGDGTPGEVDYVKGSTATGGSAAAMLPPQVACSVTELLGPDSRRHWGRFYLPGLSSNNLELDGTYNTAAVDAIAAAANSCYDAWATASYYPIVWVAGVPGFNPVPVVEVRVDNIPDIIRRRRYQSISYRVTNAVA